MVNADTRKKRAIIRDRRRGLDTADLPAIIGPMTGYQQYLLAQMYKPMMLVVDLEYRARVLYETERQGAALSAYLGVPHRPAAMMRAMLPRQHNVRVEGRTGADGRLMYLASDPDRPSRVYRRRLGHGTVSPG